MILLVLYEEPLLLRIIRASTRQLTLMTWLVLFKLFCEIP